MNKKDEELQQLKQELQHAKEEKEAEISKFLRLEETHQEARRELERVNNDLNAKAQSLAHEVEVANARSVGEVERMRQQLAQKDEEVVKFGEQMVKMTALVSSMESGLSSVTQMRQQLETALKAQQLVGELQAKTAEKDHHIAQLTKDVHAKDEELASLRDALHARSEQINQLQHEVSQTSGTHTAVVEAEVKVLQGKLSMRDQQIELLNSKLADMQVKLVHQLDEADKEEVVSEGTGAEEMYLEKEDLYATENHAAQHVC